MQGQGVDGKQLADAAPSQITDVDMLEHAAELILQLELLAARFGHHDLASHLARAYAEACRSRQRLASGI